ncbi:metallophosphoesterase [Mammaliicoccus sp. Dog046]|uniref:metallophosphoesterase n=1 Tax=Mammaliicoccus sp. Dog046 TaxID=3034233 RepID=UPI002B257AF7|nr:metallophosphoesterase [Mammaliicoccus sp. Dog046]WQK84720.1 metallophosphoesterase [Mammaliicoccus sp. Dog046]
MRIQFPSARIKVSTHTFKSQLKSNLKVVHISDLHIGYYSGIEDLHQLVLRINKLDADIVCFTGDCFDNIKFVPFDLNLVIPLFKTIQSNFGKFFVPGNHDYGSDGIETVIRIMKQSDFHVLINEHKLVKTPQGNILIHGIDDICFGRPNFESSFEGYLHNVDYRICLMHEPDKAHLIDPNINLILSGHTHGGQVRLPFYGAIYTPAFGKLYKSGLYHLRKQQYLYVNRGIGVTRLPIRIFCSPEIAVFNIKNKY